MKNTLLFPTAILQETDSGKLIAAFRIKGGITPKDLIAAYAFFGESDNAVFKLPKKKL